MYGQTLAPTLTWQNGGADGGDLVSAAATLGVPHPTGYPTYVLLAQIFLALPLGDEAYRTNLMSAFFASAAAVLVYYLALTDDTNKAAGLSQLSAAVPAVLLAFSPLVWSQATITEVYTLHLCLIAALFLALQHWRTTQRARALHPAGQASHAKSPSWGWLAGLILGLGLGNHLTMTLAIPSVVVYVWLVGKAKLATSAWLVLGLLSGLMVYLYLFFASNMGAHFHWGRIDSLPALASLVGGELYRGYLFALPLHEVPRRVLALAAMLFSEFQIWGVALALVGLVSHFRRDVSWGIATLLLAIASASFAIGYNTSDSSRYLMALWLVVAWWLVFGIEEALATLRAWRRSRLTVPIFAVTLLVLSATSAWLRYPTLDLSHDHQAEQFALQALSPLPSDSLLFSGADQQTFALWYYTEVRHVRADVIVVDQDLFAYPPYRAQLRSSWTNLVVPTDGQLDSFIKANLVQHQIFLLDPPPWLTGKYRLAPWAQLQQVIGAVADASTR